MDKLKPTTRENIEMVQLENSGILIQVWRFDDEDEKANKLTEELIKRYNIHDKLIEALTDIYNCQFSPSISLASLNNSIKIAGELIKNLK